MNRAAHWHIATLAETPVTPWRNGGGLTRELAAWPPGGDWTWRLSVADVDRAGPFSRFPDVDRWLAVLRGDGVRLSIDSRTHQLHADDPPLLFDGDAACACTLIDGDTQDLNLMVRRSQAASHMQRVRGTHTRDLPAAAFAGVYAIDASAHLHTSEASVTLSPGQFGWCLFEVASSLRVDADNALWMEVCP